QPILRNTSSEVRLLRHRAGLAGEAEGAAGGAGSVEVSGLANGLEVELRREPASPAIRAHRAREELRHLAARPRLAQHAADQLALVRDLEAENLSDRLADIGVARRRRIGETGFEIGPDRGLEVHRVAAAK